jgi:hypothetical protein
MQTMLLSTDEHAVIDELIEGPCEGQDRTFPAELDPAVHSLEARGWISLLARGAVIDGEREYTVSLTPHGLLARDDLVSGHLGRRSHASPEHQTSATV